MTYFYYSKNHSASGEAAQHANVRLEPISWNCCRQTCPTEDLLPTQTDIHRHPHMYICMTIGSAHWLPVAPAVGTLFFVCSGPFVTSSDDARSCAPGAGGLCEEPGTDSPESAPRTRAAAWSHSTSRDSAGVGPCTGLTVRSAEHHVERPAFDCGSDGWTNGTSFLPMPEPRPGKKTR